MGRPLETYDFTVRSGRGRRWKYCIIGCGNGRVIATGMEPSRHGARYRAERALFEALLTSAKLRGHMLQRPWC
jgi:hypothetical protein